MVTVFRAVLWREAREQAAILLALLAMGTAVIAAAAQFADGPTAVGPFEFRAYVEAPRMAALMLAMTAGVVVGGALFAGEREVGTFGYLQLLPARRARVWAAKVAAGAVLAGAAGLVLMTAGAVLGAVGSAAVGLWVVWGVTVCLIAYAWGAFGSALPNADSTLFACFGGLLTAAGVALPVLALAALVAEGLYASGLLPGVARRSGLFAMQLTAFLMLVLPLGLSLAVFTAPDRDRRRTAVGPDAVTAKAQAVRRAVRSRGGFGLRACLWLVARQARGSFLAVGGLMLLLGLLFLLPEVPLLAVWPGAAAFAGVMAGVLGWADEQSRGANRFWGERRLPAGRLWLAKLLVGGAVTAVWCLLLFGPSLARQIGSGAPEPVVPAAFRSGLLLTTGEPWVDIPRGTRGGGFWRGLYVLVVYGDWAPPAWVYHLLLWPVYGFAFGHLAGLLFRKTVVAAGVGLLTAAPLAGLWLPSVFAGGLKPWQVLPVPILTLLLARALMRAWGADRLGHRRPLLAIAIAGLLAAGYTGFAIGYRVLEADEIAETEDDLRFADTVPQLDSPDGGRDTRAALEQFRQADQRVLTAEPDEPLFPEYQPDRIHHIIGPRPTGYLGQLRGVFRHGWPADRPDLDRWLDSATRGGWEDVLLEAAGKPVGPLDNPRTITLAAIHRPADGPPVQMATLMLARGLRTQAAGDPLGFVPRFDAALALSRNARRQEPGPVYLQGLMIERLTLEAGERWLERLGDRPDLLHAVELALLRHEELCPRDPNEPRLAGQMITRQAVTVPTAWAGTVIEQSLPRTGFREPADVTKQRAEGEANLLAFCWQVPWERERLRRVIGLGNNPTYRTDRYLLARGLFGLTWDWRDAYQTATDTASLSAARGRCLLVAVAARRYEAERGRPPAALAELLDGYLPAVPEDPYTLKPLGYRLSSGESVQWEIDPTGGPGQNPPLFGPEEEETAAGALIGGLVAWPREPLPGPQGWAGVPPPEPRRLKEVPTGRPVVWSVGPDGVDDLGTVLLPLTDHGFPRSRRGDVIVVVPAAK